MMTPSYDDLLDEVQVLRRRLAEMAAPDEAAQLRATLGVTPKEGSLLAVLMTRPDGLTKDAIYDLVFEHDNGDGPEAKIIDVYVCKIRKKARERGWPGAIHTLWGSGYRLDAAMREFLASIVQPAPGALAA